MYSSYEFNNLGKIGCDLTDNSQQNVYNTKFTNYVLSNYFSANDSNEHIHFTTKQPSVMFSKTNFGNGLGPDSVDNDWMVGFLVELLLVKFQMNKLQKKISNDNV